MEQTVAIIGAGVSGLTCGVVFAERGWQTNIFAKEIGAETTSAAAAAIWFPYDVEPLDKAVRWALESFTILKELCEQSGTGVSMMEQRTFCRTGNIEIPAWAHQLGVAVLGRSEISRGFTDGFSMRVPLMDTLIYLNYLADRFAAAGGRTHVGKELARLEDVPAEFGTIVNCAGVGARSLVADQDLEPHRGQVALVPKLGLEAAIVCDDAPLMYAIPRTNDTVFGGTNDVSYDRQPDPTTTAAIVTECSRVLDIPPPKVLAEKVGLRPFRRTGVRVEREQLGDGRTVIHNYGHGGAGFTLSWGCAAEVLRLALAHD